MKNNKDEVKMDIKTIKTLLDKNETLGNHITTTIIIDCINQLVAMIPNDNISRLIEGTITEIEDILEQQEEFT